jgi:hypothetical protein
MLVVTDSNHVHLDSDSYEDSIDATNQNKSADDVEMESVNQGSSTGKEYDVLIRCTNGGDVNFATRVSVIFSPSPCSFPAGFFV